MTDTHYMSFKLARYGFQAAEVAGVETHPDAL